MRNFNNKSLVIPVIFFVLSFNGSIASAAPIDLLSAGNFWVLAGSAITGPSIINGDLGLSPGTSVTGFPPGIVNGTQHVADTVAAQAQIDLAAAFNTPGQTPVLRIPTELGGSTKTAGIYDSADGTFEITGTLTLDAQGNPNAEFTFKTASTLITAWASNVNLINGAQACKVNWLVGSSATLWANSTFKGNILALTSATLTTGANVEGRVLARNGAVTLDANTITRATCMVPTTPAPTTPTPIPTTPVATPVVPSASALLHIVKQVLNGTGGTAMPSDFTLHIKSAGIDVSGSPASGTGAPGISYSLNTGTYVASENANASYAQSFSGACNSSGNITLSSGDDKTCVVINTFIPVSTVSIPVSSPIVINNSNSGGVFVNTPIVVPPVPLSSVITKPIVPTVPKLPHTGVPPEEKSPLNIIILVILLTASLLIIQRKHII